MTVDQRQLVLESINRLSPQTQNFCPECGSQMKEVDRVSESTFTYVWFECREYNCNGSWLKKTPTS